VSEVWNRHLSLWQFDGNVNEQGLVEVYSGTNKKRHGQGILVKRAGNGKRQRILHQDVRFINNIQNCGQ
jgi:hypothetical protein